MESLSMNVVAKEDPTDKKSSKHKTSDGKGVFDLALNAKVASPRNWDE